MRIPSHSRRLFLAGGAAGLGAAIAGSRAAAQGGGSGIPTGPVGRPEPKLEAEPPLPLDRQVGWAVVGLGDYAQG